MKSIFKITNIAHKTGIFLPVFFTLIGLIHPEYKVWFSSLLYLVLYLNGGVLFLAYILEKVFKNYGKKLQNYKTEPPKYKSEIAETIRSLYMMATFAAWPMTSYRLGWPHSFRFTLAEVQPNHPNNYLLYFVKLIAVTLLVDFYMYWKHRLLHTRSLFGFHRHHHTFHDPSPFSGFAIHPVEAVLTFSPVLLTCLPQIPILAQAYSLWVSFFVLLNLYLHAGYQVDVIEKVLPKFFINTSVFHNIHHEKKVYHFGELLYLWDWLLDT